MVHLEPLAFLTARIAYVGASSADYARQFTAAGHIACRQTTDLCAIDIQLDAASHVLDILLAQTGYGTVIARRRAGITFVDAGLILLMSHNDLLRL
ncbi:hypothetical protein [Noviherbaspirillum agri]